MTTRFPAQIDNFPIRLPQEVIASTHVNDLQEAVVAIEVFTKALEEGINNHIHQLEEAHLATSISIDAYAGLDTSNTQASIFDLKKQLDAAIISLSAQSLANLTAHIATPIASAHPNGTFPIARLDVDVATQVELDAHIATNIATAHPNGTLPGNRVTAASITGAEIALNTISLSHLSFDLATQVELDAHIATPIASAHPIGTFPIARLDTDVATQAELNTHTTTSINVHGIGSDSFVVGTLTEQVLENKKYISDFTGSKVLLFIEEVSTEEKLVYNSSNVSAAQLEVRKKSILPITVVDHSGLTSVITVSDAYFFSDVVGITNGIKFLIPPSTLTTLATITSLSSSTTIVLDNLYPTISINDVAIDTFKANPLFSVGSDGSMEVKELHVQDNAFTDITFEDDVTITGNLTTTGTTTLQSGLSVTGNTSTTGSSTVGSTLTVGSSTTTGTLTTTGDASIGDDLVVADHLTVGGATTLNGSLDLNSNASIDGYLNVGLDLAVLGGLNVANTITAGNAISTSGSLSVTGDTILGNNVQVGNSIHVAGNTILDGYLTVADSIEAGSNLHVIGDLTVNGSIVNPPISLPIVNGQLAPTPIFSIGNTVRAMHVDYTIYRYHASSLIELASAGNLRFVHKNISNTWQLDETYTGDNVGVSFTIDASGQVFYTSTVLSGTTTSSVMKYRARSIEI